MRIAVIGAGMMARAVVYDLVRQPDVIEVRVADRDGSRLRELKRWARSPKVQTFVADAGDRAAMAALMRPCAAAIGCASYTLNLGLTRAAIATRTHFCDLGGNNTVVARQLGLDARARRAGITVVPDCGLAPGLVSVLTAACVERLDRTDAVRIRVGGLPRVPKPPLNYGIVFSAEGLINEYVEPCEVLRNGRAVTVESLADVESLRLGPPFGRLEAFNTSGGSSTLPETMRGRVRDLDYKTIRYPGHCAQVRLLFDLGLMSSRQGFGGVAPRQVLARLLEEKLGFETDDVVLLRVEAEGRRGGRPARVRYQMVDRADRRTGLTAMMRTTGFPAAVAGLTLARGKARRAGVLPGELAFDPQAFICELAGRGLALRRAG
ncbi:MAG: saccharopine dehydrogenase C-terminal domain-containing protein [bacterium]